MKIVNLELNSEKLPPQYYEGLVELSRPYFEYFVSEAYYKHQAVKDIRCHKTKLQALVDLDTEARKLLLEYEVGFYDLITDALISKKYDEFEQKAIQESTSYLACQLEVFNHLPNLIREDIGLTKAKIGMKGRYRTNSSNQSNSSFIPPRDIRVELSRLFVNSIVEAKFIEFLIEEEYITKNEEWQGLSNRPGALREAYRALKELNLLKPGKTQLSSVKVFYQRFGLKIQAPGEKEFYITVKSLSSQNKSKDFDLFLESLATLTRFHK